MCSKLQMHFLQVSLKYTDLHMYICKKWAYIISPLCYFHVDGEEIECREFSKGPIKQAAFTKFAECTAYAVDSGKKKNSINYIAK